MKTSVRITTLSRAMALTGLVTVGASQLLIAETAQAQQTEEVPHSTATRPRAAEAIAAMNRQFEEAFAAGDVATIVDQYAEDAQSFLAHKDPISGRTAIREEMAKFLAQTKGGKVSIEATEIQEMGDWAYETDKVLIRLRDGNVVASKWLLVRKFEDGKWKIHREAGNDSPSGATTNPEANYTQLAARIINSSARVKPGEMVVIAGGKHTTGLMEELAIQATIAGGLPQVLMDSDRIQRATVMDVPENYLAQPPTYLKAWVEHTDVVIGLPTLEDPQAVFQDAKPERLAKIEKSGQVFLDAWKSSKIRYVNVAYPTPGLAANVHLDFPTMQKAVWDAMSADYESISKEGNRLKQILQTGRTVRVTSPSGTDLTFQLGDRPIMVDDGILLPEKAGSQYAQMRGASLPGGTLWLAPLETSAEGRVAIPRDQFQTIHIRGESFEFSKGHLENYKAEENGQALPLYLAPHTGPKDRFGFFEIGLNPKAKVIEDPGDYRPGYAAGLVTLGIGDNEMRGGKNRVEGGAEVRFPITRATVTVDGKTIVQDGKLCF